MTNYILKSRRVGLAAFLAALLFFSSGCALFWLGLGGTGGYLIKKGEEESAKEKSSSKPEASSSSNRVTQEAAALSAQKDRQELAMKSESKP